MRTPVNQLDRYVCQVAVSRVDGHLRGDGRCSAERQTQSHEGPTRWPNPGTSLQLFGSFPVPRASLPKSVQTTSFFDNAHFSTISLFNFSLSFRWVKNGSSVFSVSQKGAVFRQTSCPWNKCLCQCKQKFCKLLPLCSQICLILLGNRFNPRFRPVSQRHRVFLLHSNPIFFRHMLSVFPSSHWKFFLFSQFHLKEKW